MTDLLQSASSSTAPATAAQLGRPTAGKTGTTTSNKDGWFIGFSSGITTGVWMGRDDNRALPGLAGGRAPARAFHDYMMRAVANRAPEAFVTEAAQPDWVINQSEDYLVCAARRRADGRPRRQSDRAAIALWRRGSGQ